MTTEQPLCDLYPVFTQSLSRLDLKPEQQLIACLGGGADSQTILDLLDRYRSEHPQYQYLAIHLDHEFHPASGEWAQGLVADCERRQFPLHTEVLEIPSGRRISKEAAGRETRYARMAELGKPAAVFLLGQHRNDQIETFLLQLKRGSGPKGLSGMAAVAKGLHQQRWVRPLLRVSKHEIYRYARHHELFWIEDETNFDTSIDRNFLRHEVVPQLERRWPQFGEAVLRSASLCAEQQQLLDELLSVQIRPLIDAEGQLQSKTLEQASPQLQRAALRFWLSQRGASMPSYAQLEQLRTQMLLTTNDANPSVNWGGYTVTRRRDRTLILSAL
ncbi:tRNA lysidine(34) synthetase TilS [Pseudidiomarina sp.]|uniref:tRNA lysidine(34) synthetase TilS n=1 Tax=Pseudidiomarina sp. TaxID=2081707 RepID=UPI00299D6569|nr:tRNA lysidine(34) synthetase TilS [Pseudidiomarina sp.]MDX1706196.1 tRNA lysidine(34) synthetase TilS [Pseudidiomarina sp.]